MDLVKPRDLYYHYWVHLVPEIEEERKLHKPQSSLGLSGNTSLAKLSSVAAPADMQPSANRHNVA